MNAPSVWSFRGSAFGREGEVVQDCSCGETGKRAFGPIDEVVPFAGAGLFVGAGAFVELEFVGGGRMMHVGAAKDSADSETAIARDFMKDMTIRDSMFSDSDTARKRKIKTSHRPAEHRAEVAERKSRPRVRYARRPHFIPVSKH